MRLNLNLPDETVAKIDNKCKELGISRTAWISMKLQEILVQEEKLYTMLNEIMPELKNTMLEQIKNDSNK